MPEENDRRKHRRYQLPFSLKMSPKGHATPIETFSRDISAKGVYFTVSIDCQPKMKFGLDLILPAPPEKDFKPRRIHCKAIVVRVEPSNEAGKIGIAAKIEKFTFVIEDHDDLYCSLNSLSVKRYVSPQ